MTIRKSRKKEVQPWRQGILAHHQNRPSAADRSEFPASIVAELIKAAQGVCQICRSAPDTHSHHVMPRGRSGRGVLTNGLRVCGVCHDALHNDEAMLQAWIDRHELLYGPYFWYDAEDWEQHQRREAAAQAAEQDRRQREADLQPLIQVFTLCAGRPLLHREMSSLHKATHRLEVLEEFNTLIRLIRRAKAKPSSEKEN